jgi:hypothetical protein
MNKFLHKDFIYKFTVMFKMTILSLRTLPGMFVNERVLLASVFCPKCDRAVNLLFSH